LRSQLGSLGLDWRIGQFEALARDLVERFDGRIPDSRDELMNLTGVSDYLADAVLVFAFGKPRAVIDANVARVIARTFGLREHAEARRDKEIRRLADELVASKRPRDYNFAMLDLAATVCTAHNPSHDTCPLRRTCLRAKTEAST
jgi:A/G-specific adenine glycosylase